jgi:hypothetical protein
VGSETRKKELWIPEGLENKIKYVGMEGDTEWRA